MTDSHDGPLAAFASVFTLPDEQAAALADLPKGSLDSLATAGHLTLLLDRGRRLYRPADIEDLRDSIRTKKDRGKTDLRRFAKALEYLGVYLSEYPPTGDYDKALATGGTLLAKSRNGIYHAHIRTDAVKRWAGRKGLDFEIHMVPLVMSKHLEAMGAVRLRGLRGSDGGGQRWEYWWRLPLAVWSLKDGTSEAERLRQLVAGSVRTSDERMRLASDGAAYVDDVTLGGRS